MTFFSLLVSQRGANALAEALREARDWAGVIEAALTDFGDTPERRGLERAVDALIRGVAGALEQPRTA